MCTAMNQEDSVVGEKHRDVVSNLKDSLYNNPATPRANILLNPMKKRFIDDGVICMSINYDKIELSCKEIKIICIPEEFKRNIRTSSQIRAIFQKDPSRTCIYREFYTSSDGILIKKDLVYFDGRVDSLVKVHFNGARHSGVTIRQYLERIFPDNWQSFRLHSYEVACDFDVDIKDFVDQGLYRSWVRGKRDYKGTKYLGTTKSKRQTKSYDKKEERLAKGFDPGCHEYRLEERSYIPPKERPLVEDWLSGKWRPKAFTHTVIGDTSVRWEGLTDGEWRSIKKHGFQTTLCSKKRTDTRKAKLRQLIKEHRWIPLETLVNESLYAWTLRYRLEYGIGVKYSGKHAKAHQSRQAKQGLRSGALHDGRRENSSNRAHYRFDNR